MSEPINAILSASVGLPVSASTYGVLNIIHLTIAAHNSGTLMVSGSEDAILDSNGNVLRLRKAGIRIKLGIHLTIALGGG